MSSPQMQFNAVGNILNDIALGGGTAYPGILLDFSTDYEGLVQLSVTAGSAVSSTNGVTATFCRSLGLAGSPTLDTRGITISTGALTVGQHVGASIQLDTGRYVMTVVNLDATNSVTCSVTTAAITGVQ